MFGKKLRKVLLAASFAFTMAGDLAAQQAWPSKPIRIIVPFAAAGPIDGAARAIASKLTESFGQSVMIENITGSGGAIGTLRAARAPADGYTLLLGHVGTLAILPHVNPTAGYDPIKDFAPVAELGEYATVLVVNANEPYKTTGDLLKAAQENPGKIAYGSTGSGSSGHLSAELMASMAGVKFTHVPYRGNAPAMVDLIAGRITFMFDVLLNSAPQIQAGKIRALGVSNQTGLAQLPGVPPISKSLAGYEVFGWLGLVAPPGVPKPIVDRLSAEVEKITKMPDFVAQYAGYGFDAKYASPERFAELIKKDYQLWGPVVKSTGARMD